MKDVRLEELIDSLKAAVRAQDLDRLNVVSSKLIPLLEQRGANRRKTAVQRGTCLYWVEGSAESKTIAVELISTGNLRDEEKHWRCVGRSRKQRFVWGWNVLPRTL